MVNSYTKGMKTPMNAITSVVEAVLRTDAIRATKYLAPNQVVRATKRTFKFTKGPRENVEVLLTLGRPNYVEREFVKDCKKAGEPFPVKKVQLKFKTPKKGKLAPRKKKNA